MRKIKCNLYCRENATGSTSYIVRKKHQGVDYQWTFNGKTKATAFLKRLNNWMDNNPNAINLYSEFSS